MRSLSDKLKTNYDLFSMSLFGAYSKVRAPGIKVTPQSLTKFKLDAWKMGAAFCETSDMIIDDYASSTSINATESDCVRFEERKAQAKKEIRSVVIENVHQAEKMLRVGTDGAKSLLTGSTGAIGLLVQRGASDMKLRSTMCGKQVSSDAHVQLIGEKLECDICALKGEEDVQAQS